jgi:hypothetical protein
MSASIGDLRRTPLRLAVAGAWLAGSIAMIVVAGWLRAH